MKKIFTLFAAVLCGLALNAKTIYLTPGVWADGEAVIFVHSWTGESGNAQDLKMNDAGSVLSVDVPDGNEKIIFVRMPNGSTALVWDNKWDQTSDLEIPSDKNMYVVTDWHDGHWAVYGGGDQPGPGPQPQPGGDHDYYLKGYRGETEGDITTPGADELFECGKLDYAFEGKEGLGYFFVLVCEQGTVVGECYRAKAYSTEQHTTLWPESVLKAENLSSEVLAVPAPSATFYLYDNGDGSLELSTVELPNRTLVGNCGGSQPEQEAVENTVVNTKTRKAIIDGRLVIIRGEQMFDATGRAL